MRRFALEDAIQQAASRQQVSHPRTGLIMGSGGGSPANQIEAADTLRDKGIRRVGPYQVTRCMSSTVSACLATNFKVKGINYSITSACSTSAHCIGAAAQQIAWGMQDVMFAGGGEELSWGMSLLFDGMGAMSSKYNETPEKASRAYDANRDGFVIAGGGGAVVLESLEHALARGANHPGRSGGLLPPAMAKTWWPLRATAPLPACSRPWKGSTPPSTTSTRTAPPPRGRHAGSARHPRAPCLATKVPPFSSTKSLTGHSLGATGVQEAIYCLIMLNKGFIAARPMWKRPTPRWATCPGDADARCAAEHGAVQQLRFWWYQRQPGAAPLDWRLTDGALSRSPR